MTKTENKTQRFPDERVEIKFASDDVIEVSLPKRDFPTILRLYANNTYKHKVKVAANTTEMKVQHHTVRTAGKIRVNMYYGKRVIYASNVLNRASSKTKRSAIVTPRVNQTEIGSLDSANTYCFYKIKVNSAIKISLTASPDFDLYARFLEDDYWRYRSCSSSGNEIINVPKPDVEKEMYVLVYRFSGSGSYKLLIEDQNKPLSWSEGSKKKVLLCGISDYLNMSDLSYCDEDVHDWYNYLTSKGYECRVLGDIHKTTFPVYDGLATKENIRNAVKTLVNTAKEGDTIAIMSSGHGESSGNNSSYLCCYGGQKYYDTELASDLSGYNGNKILILDHCFSGGFSDEMTKLPNIFFGATCTGEGYGYDVDQFDNGAFTYEWHCALPEHGDKPLTEIYKVVEENYDASFDTADRPMSVCTNDSIKF